MSDFDLSALISLPATVYWAFTTLYTDAAILPCLMRPESEAVKL